MHISSRIVICKLVKDIRSPVESTVMCVKFYLELTVSNRFKFLPSSRGNHPSNNPQYSSPHENKDYKVYT